MTVTNLDQTVAAMDLSQLEALQRSIGNIEISFGPEYFAESGLVLIQIAVKAYYIQRLRERFEEKQAAGIF